MNCYVLMIFVGLMVNVLGQTTGDSEFWQSLDENEKIAFVKGVYIGLTESLNVLSEEAIRQKNQDPYWVPPFVHDYSTKRLKEFYSEEVGYDYVLIARLLDAFYSNPDNAHINMMSALRILILHQAGETNRANELLLIKQKEVLKGR